MEKEVSLYVKCPLCDGSLMDETHPICDKPSVKLNIETEHDRGTLRLVASMAIVRKPQM